MEEEDEKKREMAIETALFASSLVRSQSSRVSGDCNDDQTLQPVVQPVEDAAKD